MGLYDYIVDSFGDVADAAADRQGITNNSDRNAFAHAYTAAKMAKNGRSAEFVGFLGDMKEEVQYHLRGNYAIDDAI